MPRAFDRFSLCAALTLVMACRQLVGIDERSEDDARSTGQQSGGQQGGGAGQGGSAGKGAAPGPTLASLSCGALPGFGEGDEEACRACVAESCCGQVAACRSDDTCQRRLECLAACADDACVEGCQRSYADDAFGSAALACRAAACAQACKKEGSCGTEPLPLPSECSACSQQHCCPELEAVQASQAALQTLLCKAACAAGDTTCVIKCRNSYPGNGSLVDLAICQSKQCSGACPSVQVFPAETCGTLGVGAAGSDCQTCLDQDPDACERNKACTADPACVQMVNCVATCGSSASCANACRQAAGPLAAAKSDAFDVAAEKNCGSLCGGSSPSQCGWFYGVLGPCFDCAEQACCDDAYACGVVPECIAYEECQRKCSDIACFASCASAYAQGAGLYKQKMSCLAAKCASACFSGSGAAGSGGSGGSMM